MIKAVIFDLDGTLVDSLEDLAGVINRALSRRSLPTHSLYSYRFMVGNGFRNLVINSLPAERRSEGFIEEMRAEAAADYTGHCVERTRPYSGMPELIAALVSRRVQMAILSNKPHELTRKIVMELFADAPFAIIRGESPDFPRKPDPASALDIAARLGAGPTEVLYLGDSDVDMATARAAGMKALGAAWGFRGEPELKASGADSVLHKPRDLLAFL